MADFSEVRDGARLAGFMPYLDAELTSMTDQLVMKTLMALNSGTLTPDLALHAWMELNAYTRLLKRFQQKVQVGLSVGQRNAGILSGNA